MTPDPTDSSAEPTTDLALDVDALLAELFAEAAPRSETTGLGDLLGLLGATAAGSAFEVEAGEVVFDAEGDPALVGVRAAGVLEGQQLVVEAGELTVVLDVVTRDAAGDAPEGEAGRSVRGEVLGTDEVLSVQLLDGVLEVALAVTDALGEFAFDMVPPGTYELIVAGAHREVSATVTVH